MAKATKMTAEMKADYDRATSDSILDRVWYMSNKNCLRVSADTADNLLCEVWDMAKKLKGEVVMLINHKDAGWLDWSSNVGMIGMTGGYKSLPIFAVDDLPRGKVVVTTKKHQNKRDWSSSQAKIINILVTDGDDW